MFSKNFVRQIENESESRESSAYQTAWRVVELALRLGSYNLGVLGFQRKYYDTAGASNRIQMTALKQHE